ncbi:MAG: NAD(P)H-binding protein [Anaerolineaceae bacterium]|nr:NAD(P)H-binding protein [Anaerolineaceae bacterium]
MRLIIDGGSGLIGRALAKSLIANDHEVLMISRDPEAVHNLQPGVKAVDWGRKTLAGHMQDADAIVNLAGASVAGENLLKMRWTEKRKKQILESWVNSGMIISEVIWPINKKPEV